VSIVSIVVVQRVNGSELLIRNRLWFVKNRISP
jgi:hypothetical protein